MEDTVDSTVETSAERRMPPNAGKGRVKGVPNKLTSEVKQMVLDALEGLGGVDYLMDKAESHPAAFLALVSKVIPLQVTGKLEHEHSGSLSAETQGFLDQVRAIADNSSGPSPVSH